MMLDLYGDGDHNMLTIIFRKIAFTQHERDARRL